MAQVKEMGLNLDVICGYFGQRLLKFNERRIFLTLISRKSRFNCGPRFLRRGFNPNLQCANEFETE